MIFYHAEGMYFDIFKLMLQNSTKFCNRKVYNRSLLRRHKLYGPIKWFKCLFVSSLGFKPSVQCAPIENTTYYNESDVTTTLSVEYRECSVVFTKNFTNGTTKREETPCPAGYSYNVPKERSLVAEVRNGTRLTLNSVKVLDFEVTACFGGRDWNGVEGVSY